MKKSLLLIFSKIFLLIVIPVQYGIGQTYHDLSSGSLLQDWSNTGLITANDDWSSIQSIRGYLGADGTSTTGIDPQTVLMPLNDIDVVANQTNPNTLTAGGVIEFHLTDPVVALSGSGTADAPCIVIFVNTTSCSNIKIKYDLRDIDGSADNAVQAIALQYRIGETVNFTNIPSGFVADASTGPSLAELVTHVDALLPSDCNNQSQVQIRIITTNAGGNDEYIGIDNIVVEVDDDPPVAQFDPANLETGVLTDVTPVITFEEPVRKTDGNAIENSDLSTLISLKKTNSAGEDVAFTAAIDVSKKVITVDPSSSLDNSQVYYLAIGPVEDASGNESSTQSASFTTASAATPTITITAPVGGEVLYANSPTTITWTSANITTVQLEVYVPDDSKIYHWQPLGPNVLASEGHYDLIVPSDAPYGTGYKIRVSDASNTSVNSESGAFTVIAYASSILNLRENCIEDDIVNLDAEVIITFKRSASNQKFIQDATAGLLIYDPSGILTTTLNEGDIFSGLEGKIDFYGGVMEIIPTKATVNVISTGNQVSPPEMTLTEYITNYTDFESMLIKLSDITFNDADGSTVFVQNTNYIISDGTSEATFRTFATGESNVVGWLIPGDHVKLTCIAGFFNTTVQVYARTTSDFDIITGINELSEKDVTIYPVPATTELRVRNSASIKTLEILDASGRIIRTMVPAQSEELIVPVGDLKNGMYIIRLYTGKGNITKRFIK